MSSDHTSSTPECMDSDDTIQCSEKVDEETSIECKVSTLGPCHLVELPSELFLHICSFLDAKFVAGTLGLVCKSFYSIVSNDRFWKVRIRKRWHKKYPAIPVNDDCFDWKEACIQREQQCKLWTNPDETMEFFSFSKDFYAAVDVVHLMKAGNQLAAGCRDHSVYLLDLTKFTSDQPDSIDKLATRIDAHKGWVWTIDSLDNTLSTGSWDTYIKFWDMAANCELKQEIKLKSAVLCSHYERDLFIAGSFDKKVYLLDTRSGDIIAENKYHKQPVLCLAVNDNFIVSGSEDSTVCVYDRRAACLLKTVNFDEYPMSLSYLDDQLWVGDKTGLIHLVDATDGDFNLVETYDVNHKGKITSIISTLGALFTSSGDKTVKVLEPSVDPSVIQTLDKQTDEVAGIDFQNDVLAIANSSGMSVSIYKPKGS